MIYAPTNYFYGDKIKKHWIPRACGNHSTGVWWRSLKEGDHLEDKSVDW